MAREVIFIIEEPPEGGYEARAVALSVSAEADTLDEPRARIKDAVRCCLEPTEMPALIQLHQVREEVIAA